jgi:hypothetical protein
LFFQENLNKNCTAPNPTQNGLANGSHQIPTSSNGQVKSADDNSKSNIGQLNNGSGSGTGNESPDDQEKEERRRAAQKVFGKQG